MSRARLAGVPLLWLSLAASLPAAPWILESVPKPVVGIPLDPVQIVDAWKGVYHLETQKLFVFATASRWFLLPKEPKAVGWKVKATTAPPWTLVFLFPPDWDAARQASWFDKFLKEYRSLETLPAPGWPLLFPSVLGE